MKRFAASIALILLSPSAALAQASEQAYETIQRIGGAMERCWFNSGDPAFAGYAYSPEPNATTGPRILIVPKDSPEERPALVIEIRAGNNINAFGTLTASALAPRIQADLTRWLRGGGACE